MNSMDIILQDLDPRETYLKWFSSNNITRPNGRKLLEIPTINFKTDIVSSAEGSVMVNYGETIIIATVKTEVAEPEVNEPERGFIVTNFHFAAGARNDVKPGPPSEEVQAITDKLAKIIKSCVIDTKTLCIMPNCLSRVVYIDAVCLCDTGYAFEAALLASMISLKNAALPLPSFNEETGIVSIDSETEFDSININSWPCSFTFASIDKNILIMEPDSQEKIACGKSCLNLIVDLKSGNLIEVEKYFIKSDDEEIFDQIQPVIKEASEYIRSLLEL